MMLHQKRSGSLARLKYLLALPLCGAMLCQSTLGFSKTYGIIDIGTKKANALAADTIKKNSKTKVTKEIYNPNAPKPDVSKVKFPPPPPPPEPPKRKIKVTDVKLLPPPPPPEPPVRKVKAKKAQKLKEVTIDEPVSANAPVTEIRITEPAKASAQPVNEIRIEEPAPKAEAKPVKKIRIEPAKKGELSTFSIGTKN